MRICTNPGCYQGDPGNPPEFRSTASDECALCFEEIDLDDDEHCEIDAGYVCEDCTRDHLKSCLQCETRFYPTKSDVFCSPDCKREFNAENSDARKID